MRLFEKLNELLDNVLDGLAYYPDEDDSPPEYHDRDPYGGGPEDFGGDEYRPLDEEKP